MTNEECRLAVTRAAERHFVDLLEPVICSVERRPKDGEKVPFVVAAVSASIVRDIEQVVSELDWRIDRVIPAHAAWISSAQKQSPGLRRGDGNVVVAGVFETTVLIVRGGVLSLARRLRVGEVLTDDNAASVVLRDMNCSVVRIAAEAARFTRSLELLSDSARARRRETNLRVTRALLAIAAACIVATGAIYRWGLAHRLEIIEKQRAAIHSGVNRAVAARDTFARLVRSINAMQSLERSSPRWSKAMARVAVALPHDASLVSLRADGDSVTLEGQSSNAALTFTSLRSAPGIVDVHATAPIRQELASGPGALERWTLVIRVPPKAAPRDDRK
jgi:hypothetical protein